MSTRSLSSIGRMIGANFYFRLERALGHLPQGSCDTQICDVRSRVDTIPPPQEKYDERFLVTYEAMGQMVGRGPLTWDELLAACDPTDKGTTVAVNKLMAAVKE